MFGRNNVSNDVQPDFEIFTIYDLKAGCYEDFTRSKNKETCVRELINLFADPRQADNKFLVNAEDYQVFKIGSYSRKTGMLTSQQPEHVANLHELRTIAMKAWQPPRHQTAQELGIVPT